jgi:triphosphoribosyl-dephospho-CoA synthase
MTIVAGERRAEVTGSIDLAVAAQLACLLEVSAPKPGNVAPGRHFADARYEDFLASAVAIGEPIAGAGSRPVGATVRLAIEATARWTRSNTNLGIVLLLAPLARAASGLVPVSCPFFDFLERLRRDLGHVLHTTTIDDARDVYAAIRRASPGGLGRVGAQDVAGEPSVALLDAMRLAADRDGIAREYTTRFEATFQTGVPALHRALGDPLCWNDAVVETFLSLLAAAPDTHIARRHGPAVAADVSAGAGAALAAGGVRSTQGRLAIDRLDRALRDADRPVNPGTTADLTTAAIFVVLLGGAWRSPSDL